MRDSLTQKTVSGVFWKLAERVGAQLVTAIVTMVLASILLPEEFGIVSLVTILITLCNVFVINGMDNSIRYLQEEVISYEQSLAEAEGVYTQLTDPSNIKAELAEMGYTDVASSNIVTVSVGEKADVIELQGETNWFDAICNFLSRVFG